MYERSLIAGKPKSERAEEEEKEWEEGRASQRDISGEQCRSCRNMIRAISPSKAAWHGRHARIRMKGPFRKPEPPLCVPRFSKRVLRIHSSQKIMLGNALNDTVNEGGTMLVDTKCFVEVE